MKQIKVAFGFLLFAGALLLFSNTLENFSWTKAIIAIVMALAFVFYLKAKRSSETTS